MNRIFFTSDHHFGHDNILRYCEETRAFASIEEMDLDYAVRWNEVVGPGDIVWYLGDFSMKMAVVEIWLPQLNGRKHLVIGNHDINGKELTAQRQERFLAAGFASVADSAVLEVEGVRFALCHYPYRVPPKYLSADPRIASREQAYAPRSLVSGQQAEAALLHGHIHQNWRAKKQPARLPELNVGVDAWSGVPVSGETLAATFREVRAKGEDGMLTIYGEWLPAGRLRPDIG